MTDWLTRIRAIRETQTRLVAGVMSGTSVDGVDVAFCEISGTGIPHGKSTGAKVTLRALETFPYPPALQARVRKALSSSARELSELHTALGKMFGEAVLFAAKQAKISLTEIDLIGSHGQTVYHHSGVSGAQRSTLQLGDGDEIAEMTGCPVIFDFRARDIASGGEGAPLTPYADAVFFATKGDAVSRRGVLNLGGISNLTVLDADPTKIIGFDCGPANAPIDRIVRKLRNDPTAVDIDGALARSGSVNQKLLNELLSQDAYLKRTPPKSTGFEMYGDDFVSSVIAKHGTVDVHLLATITEFVARAIGDAVKNFTPLSGAGSQLVLAGGGAKNIFLAERLKAALPAVSIVQSDSLGIPVSAREAMAFALFANEFVCGTAVSLPSVTGAKEARMLGKLAIA